MSLDLNEMSKIAHLNWNATPLEGGSGTSCPCSFLTSYEGTTISFPFGGRESKRLLFVATSDS
jgi:hypothetical protein